jgi:hypothetical protein
MRSVRVIGWPGQLEIRNLVRSRRISREGVLSFSDKPRSRMLRWLWVGRPALYAQLTDGSEVHMDLHGC